MGESHENLLKVVKHCQESLDKYTETRNDNKLLHYLEKLGRLPIKVVHLEQTGVGRTVNGLRKLGGDVGDSAKGLVAKWKEMVVGEQQEEEEEDDDEEEEDDDEDGYQSGEDPSCDSDDKDQGESSSSSHRKSEKHDKIEDRDRNKDRDRKRKAEDKGKHNHHKHNGHKSHKRKHDTSSEEEISKKKHRRKRDSHSEEEQRREKKHKSDKHREKERSKERLKESHKDKESSSKDKEKHKRREEDRKYDKKAKDKSEQKKEKSSTSKSVKGGLSSGIDSGSGASFAEALGMCEPSSSKTTKKKVKEEKKEKPKHEETVPKPPKEPALDPIDLSSLLPPITPNYRPLGNQIMDSSPPKKTYNEYETLATIITSKNLKTKVYSGNKLGNGIVPSLFELCSRILQDHIDALEYTGGVPYLVLKAVLEKATPNQLYTLEHHNPYLIEDTDELWKRHCQKNFRNKHREEMETWREMYLRCLDERDAKLKALTANIKQSQDKSLPVRMTKLAYVDSVAKPPRNIARKQMKNGIIIEKKPTMTPAARLASLATAGEAGKVAVPNPGGRAVERTASHAHAQKPKKAPLMLKSISSFKNRFKR